MQPSTYTLYINGQQVDIHGFIASLLLQGEEWDIRCMESDIYDYHRRYYARMDATEALCQELEWWWDFCENESLTDVAYRDDMLDEGVEYLIWQAQNLFALMEEKEKLTLDTAIYLDEERYLFKDKDVLTLFPIGENPDFDAMIHGFAAQLLSYAASCSMEYVVSHHEEYDSKRILRMIGDWLATPPTIKLKDIPFEVPDVYRLYATYVEEEKAKWDADNKKRYLSEQPEVRCFMTNLLERVQNDAQKAIAYLTPYLSTYQMAACQRYLSECQQYIIDRTQTRRKPYDESFDQFFCEGVTDYYKEKALERIHKAVLQDKPAAMLALEVKKLRQEKILLRNFHSYKRFVDIVNRLFNTSIKADSFSKHFRRR